MRRCLNCMNEYQEQFGEVCPHCGYVADATEDGGIGLRPGTILQERYIVGTVLKSRDTDIIYIGWDALFDRKVQIQEYFPRYCATRSLQPELTVYGSKAELFNEGLDLFYRQSRQLIRLYKEPDVITYHACFRANKTAYAIMDYRMERTLKSWLKTRNAGAGEAKALFAHAFTAVNKCHQIGVYHGMIDSETFYVTGDGHLVLKDFGAWRYVSGEPGVVDYGNGGVSTDVYRLSRLFCQLATGKEVPDEDEAKLDLMLTQAGLNRQERQALKHALSHSTKSMQRFQEEFGGQILMEHEEAFEKRRSKRRDARRSLELPHWVFWVAGGLVAAAAAMMILMATGVIQFHMSSEESRMERNMVRVPNVVKSSVKEAEKKLKKNGLGMIKEKMVYSDEVSRDQISYQSIKESDLVEKGTDLVVWVSLGKEKGVIPIAKGYLLEEVERSLKKSGFTNIRIEESMEPGVYNTILNISEEEGANVELDKEIVLTVCMNQADQEGDANVQVIVPDLQNMDRSEAEKVLTAEEFEINWIEEFSDEPVGTILGQNPKAGTEVNKGSYVTVRISKGAEKIYMKNVQLMSEEEARKEIEALGLKVGNVTSAYSESVASGMVISQSVKQDAEVKKGDSVDLVISKGREPAKQQPQTKPQTKPPTQPQTQPPEPPTQPPEPPTQQSGKPGSGLPDVIWENRNETEKNEEAPSEVVEIDPDGNALVESRPEAEQDSQTNQAEAEENSKYPLVTPEESSGKISNIGPAGSSGH